jgi:putative oxygen-independent coproporphyrinogen III oxidase
MSLTSLYIHIPFCVHRCGYCDFNTYAGLQKWIPEYVQAVCRELEIISTTEFEPLAIHTIYFGGGTPSLVTSDGIKTIINTVKRHYDCSNLDEISLEANPGTISTDYFGELRQAGVNRVSLGMQSANETELALLQRQHTFEDVTKAVKWARAAGINNLNLDLIFGLPNQKTAHWMASLEAAISLRPEHLSLYGLTIEHGTPLQHEVETGALAHPDPDLAADMYEAARDRLPEAGFVHYEISNWARESKDKESFVCKHNLQYWRTLPYLGIGAGAHGFINHYRTENIANPVAYIKRFRDHPLFAAGQATGFPKSPATLQASFIDQNTEIGENMMMGLRLVQEGISGQEFYKRYGLSLDAKYGAEIKRLIEVGLLERIPADSLRLTNKGQLLGNLVFREFI